MQYALRHFQYLKGAWLSPSKELDADMIKDFNPKKDALVIPKSLNVDGLVYEVRSKVQEWDRQGVVIRLNFINTPAVIKSR